MAVAVAPARFRASTRPRRAGEEDKGLRLVRSLPVRHQRRPGAWDQAGKAAMTTDNAKKKAVRGGWPRRERATPRHCATSKHLLEWHLGGASIFSPDCCANCDQQLDMETLPLFCSELCTEVASFVRYARRVIADPGRATDPDVLEKMQIRQAHIVGGGYPAKDRRIPDAL